MLYAKMPTIVMTITVFYVASMGGSSATKCMEKLPLQLNHQPKSSFISKWLETKSHELSCTWI